MADRGRVHPFEVHARHAGIEVERSTGLTRFAEQIGDRRVVEVSGAEHDDLGLGTPDHVEGGVVTAAPQVTHSVVQRLALRANDGFNSVAQLGMDVEELAQAVSGPTGAHDDDLGRVATTAPLSVHEHPVRRPPQHDDRQTDQTSDEKVADTNGRVRLAVEHEASHRERGEGAQQAGELDRANGCHLRGPQSVEPHRPQPDDGDDGRLEESDTVVGRTDGGNQE